jgi:hypothetical protein
MNGDQVWNRIHEQTVEQVRLTSGAVAALIERTVSEDIQTRHWNVAMPRVRFHVRFAVQGQAWYQLEAEKEAECKQSNSASSS